MAAHVSRPYFFSILPFLWGFLIGIPVVTLEPCFQGSPLLFVPRMYRKVSVYFSFTKFYKGLYFQKEMY